MAEKTARLDETQKKSFKRVYQVETETFGHPKDETLKMLCHHFNVSEEQGKALVN